jgi:hypothetical protein
MEMIPTPQQLAEEALRALKDSPMTAEEHIEFLVQQGIIDRSGRVLVNKLFGDSDIQQADTSDEAASSDPEA